MAGYLNISFAVAAAAMTIAIDSVHPAAAQEGFPFGSELTLEAAPMRGSKRIPNIEIGDNGEVKLEMWCKGAEGQFSVANDTVIFIPGAVDDRDCPPDRAQADDNLMSALGDIANWKMQGDALTLIGSRTLRFHLTTN